MFPTQAAGTGIFWGRFSFRILALCETGATSSHLSEGNEHQEDAQRYLSLQSLVPKRVEWRESVFRPEKDAKQGQPGSDDCRRSCPSYLVHLNQYNLQQPLDLSHKCKIITAGRSKKMAMKKMDRCRSRGIN
jgi:hypothetical protein